MKLISIIVPCYNEEENIKDFYDELMKTESFFKEHDVDMEIIYVNDGDKFRDINEIHEEALKFIGVK